MKQGYRNLSCAIVVVVLLISLAIAPTLLGQAISGDVVGTVVDKSGAAVPNAMVEATNDATGIKASTKTSDQGDFRFGNLPVGTYTVKVSAPNFSTLTMTQIKVELNRTGSLKATLEVGAQATTVEFRVPVL